MCASKESATNSSGLLSNYQVEIELEYLPEVEAIEYDVEQDEIYDADRNLEIRLND